MTKSPDAGRTRQALREATMASHDRVDALFADFSLDNARDYADFLSAHSRALSALEPAALRRSVAWPDCAGMPPLYAAFTVARTTETQSAGRACCCVFHNDIDGDDNGGVRERCVQHSCTATQPPTCTPKNRANRLARALLRA